MPFINKNMLAKGPRKKDTEGMTAFFYAASNHQWKVAKVLKDSGVNTGMGRAKDQASVLAHACLTDNVRLAQFAMKMGVPLNRPTKDGETPLYIACKRPRGLDIAAALLKAGADPNVQRESTMATALFIAAERGRMEVVRMLTMAKADISVADFKGVAPLAAAARHGHHEALAHLIALGADVNQAAMDGSTALHAAASVGNARACGTLLEAGAMVNARCVTNGFTPLHTACSAGPGKMDLRLVRLLLGRGADSEARASDGVQAISMVTVMVQYARRPKPRRCCSEEGDDDGKEQQSEGKVVVEDSAIAAGEGRRKDAEIDSKEVEEVAGVSVEERSSKEADDGGIESPTDGKEMEGGAMTKSGDADSKEEVKERVAEEKGNCKEPDVGSIDNDCKGGGEDATEEEGRKTNEFDNDSTDAPPAAGTDTKQPEGGTAVDGDSTAKGGEDSKASESASSARTAASRVSRVVDPQADFDRYLKTCSGIADLLMAHRVSL